MPCGCRGSNYIDMCAYVYIFVTHKCKYTNNIFIIFKISGRLNQELTIQK
jgi:hypothetical protein